MGYRSDVGLVLDKKSAALLWGNMILSPIASKINDLLSNAKRKINLETGDELYLWTNIKWYSEYEEIKWLTDFLNNLDEISWYFIRIGESIEDIDVHGFYFDNTFELDVSRSINFNQNIGEKK